MQKAELTALAEKVCTYLPGWSVVPCEWEHVVKIGDGLGHTLNLNGSHAGRGRLAISGNYPRDKESNQCYGRRALPYNQQLPSITVANDKSAKVIAGDIQRRLLTEYLTIHAQAVALEQQDQTNEAASKSAGQRLAAAGARLGRFDGCYQTFDMSYNDGGYIREGKVSGNSVSMDIRSISVEQAEAILKIISAE